MDRARMLEMCRRDQWNVDDLDWSAPPRAMSRDDEIAIVQLFTDMAAIERLAGALFQEQRRRATDPILQSIFDSFVIDEERHSVAAQRLAEHYDVHRYQRYATNVSLTRFQPHFLRAVTLLSDEVANTYITVGELILDVALLRSINDHVADAMSEQAMRLINRDESRHIAVDYHMTEYYASDAYWNDLARRPPLPILERARAWWTFAMVFYYAKPFFKDVFFDPMDRVDPSGRRIREAFKRYQQIGAKPGVKTRGFGRFLSTMSDAFNHPILGAFLGPAISRVLGVEPRFLERMNSDEELDAAARKSFDQLAAEALALKLSVQPA